jgi:CheY-like chemotaxis protein
VLVVDDDASVSQIVAEMLMERGYTVTAAPDALAALEILRGAAPFDVLLADYGMPGMDGAELIRAAETLRPGLRTLLMTGLAELRAGTLIDTAYIMRKPFNVSALDERLQALLARPMLRVLQGGASGAA